MTMQFNFEVRYYSISVPACLAFSSTESQWEWPADLHFWKGLAYFDWIPVERLLPRRWKRHGDDSIWKQAWYEATRLLQKAGIQHNTATLGFNTWITPTCDIGKVKVKPILLIAPFVFWDLRKFTQLTYVNLSNKIPSNSTFLQL